MESVGNPRGNSPRSPPVDAELDGPEAHTRQDVVSPEVQVPGSFEPRPLVSGGASALEKSGPVLGRRNPATVLGIELLAPGDIRHSGGRKPCDARIGARGVHVSDGGQHEGSFGWFYQG